MRQGRTHKPLIPTVQKPGPITFLSLLFKHKYFSFLGCSFQLTYFTHTLSITPQPYHSQTLFSPFHLAGASNDDVNIQAIEKSSIDRSYILILSVSSENFLSINQLLSSFLLSCLHRTFILKHSQYQYNLHHSTKRRG
jgi:hypothetical protein